MKKNKNIIKIDKKDWIIMFIMMFLYGIISFYRLGDIKVPNTYKTFENDKDSVVIKLKEEQEINKMRYYTGNNLGEIKVSLSIDGNNYEYISDIKVNSVFTWQDLLINKNAKYIMFTGKTSNSSLGDIQLYDSNNSKIAVEEDKYNPLLDELDLVPDEISFLNSTYFDEIYYARSAYEYAHGIDCYEWTHPPLGKLIIAIPIVLFGFSPFTFRLMSNLSGLLMIPVMYILAKKLFKDKKWAILGASLMMFDNFHFSHTRIALIDGFQVLFILLSVLFMKMYLDLDDDDPLKKKAKYLLLSGTFIGCAITTKWNALYIGLGLAIVFFSNLLRKYNINVIKYCKNNFKIDLLLRILAIFVLVPYAYYYLSCLFLGKSFSSLIIYYYLLLFVWLFIKLIKFLLKDNYLLKLFSICILSFIVIPLIIYILSYILFPTISYYDRTIDGIFKMAMKMYDYHSSLNVTHPFSSSWYQWPIMFKPVWFYTSQVVNGTKMTIVDIGNPAIWWSGIVSFVYLVINLIKKKDMNSKFLLVFIFTSFVPYIFVSRIMYMYHFFITLPFIMLGIVAFIKYIIEKTKNNKIYYYYLAIVIITFIIFYPVVSGLPVPNDYIDALKWLPEWYF